MRKKLPTGIQSFEKIRSDNYYYVDKTYFIKKLLEEGNYYFLSRPRRFGKSLFLDTLKQAFLGKKELFQGLYLEKNWDWSQKYPVIHLDFGGRTLEKDESNYLRSWIIDQLKRNQVLLDVECHEDKDYAKCLEELIFRAYKKYGCKVVVLIDEYDKPILDRIEDRDKAKEIREILKNLYSVLKPLDYYLRFVFITGVTKFSKVSLFSGINQLNDITLDRAYSTICGYTEEELREVFAEELGGVDLEALRCWYNGYSFCGEPVYNPFDILLYLQKREYRPFWFETGTPSFLLKVLGEKKFYFPELEEMKLTEDLLSSFEIENIEPETLLFQTGYLTIKECESTLSGVFYTLSYPNKEVRVALNQTLVRYLTQSTTPLKVMRDVGLALASGDVEKFGNILKNVFASIPYEWHRKNEIARYEGYYASVIYSFLLGTGLDVIAEDWLNKGRIDLTIKVGDKFYLLEFKVLEREDEVPKALQALKERSYVEKYRAKAREIYLIGIDFSQLRGEVVSFAWEKVAGT